MTLELNTVKSGIKRHHKMVSFESQNQDFTFILDTVAFPDIFFLLNTVNMKKNILFVY